MVLAKKFYEQDTVELAKSLLGCFLVVDSADGKAVGRIVETEAYTFNDPSSHSFKGQTLRNFSLFGPPGFSYVYLIYGMYYCLNVSSAKKGVGEAVLIRALEPVAGIELMQKRRKTQDLHKLCSGPGRLCQAMDITLSDNNLDLTKSRLKILSLDSYPKQFPAKRIEVESSKRIGINIAIDVLHRFTIKENKFVSKI